jgi:hypothetical protein
VDPNLSLLDSGLEKLVKQPHRFEHFERTRVDHGGPVPLHRSDVLVDDAAADVPSLELGCKEQTSGTRSHDEDRCLDLSGVTQPSSSLSHHRAEAGGRVPPKDPKQAVADE